MSINDLNKLFITQILGLGLAAGTSSAVWAQSQIFSCPPAGTMVQVPMGTMQSLGTEPNDPYTCTKIDVRGRHNKYLFNFYQVKDASQNATIVPAMLDLISGRQKTVSFDFIWGAYKQTKKWTFLRRESIVIGDKTFNAIVLEEETANDTWGAPSHFRYTLWLNPQDGLWLKQVFENIDGYAGSNASRTVRSVTFPNTPAVATPAPAVR